MAEINLLDKYPRTKRDFDKRGAFLNRGAKENQEIYVEHLLLRKVREFGQEYFDGDRLYGYGGYHYNPRFWAETVVRFRDHYHLAEDVSILDIGCAKGFMLYDFKRLLPHATVAGIDISPYAIAHAHPEIKPFLQVGNARKLPFPDQSIDLVISINTVDHLPLDECLQALREIQRVTRKYAFVSVNAWHNEQERKKQRQWNVTAISCLHVDDWRKIFSKAEYTKDYYWHVP